MGKVGITEGTWLGGGVKLVNAGVEVAACPGLGEGVAGGIVEAGKVGVE